MLIVIFNCIAILMLAAWIVFGIVIMYREWKESRATCTWAMLREAPGKYQTKCGASYFYHNNFEFCPSCRRRIRAE